MMNYDTGSEEWKNWIISERSFNKKYLGKCESIMVLGNGYMGVRSATEEAYIGEKRNTFVAGTFNRFDQNEVTELPNAADLIQLDIEVNGEVLDLTKGTIHNYNRQLNLRTGELCRSFTWVLTSGEEYDFRFKRFISLVDLHLIGQKIEIIPRNCNSSIKITSGINGQLTNSGVQHFSEGDQRLYENKYLQLVQTTTESKIDFLMNMVHNFKINEQIFTPESMIHMDRRKIYFHFDTSVNKGQTLMLEKISTIQTSRDRNLGNISLRELKNISYAHLKKQSSKGYETLFIESVKAWETRVWKQYGMEIESEHEFDQLAIRFAHYHLTIMTPAHDNRMNIGAKGLSGEGYKGHTFWDTEIFILPFWIYSAPKTARSLLEYRFFSLSGAHKKANENGYKGAMYPWESAWLDDGEVTPVWGAADIVTGEQTKIWSGFIEQHITADVAYAVRQYFQVTNDNEFMNEFGFELLFDTAKFWCSRLEWSIKDRQYHINDVVGPDEYKEHVNNNAFTNYMAYWTMKNALAYAHLLKKQKQSIFQKLNAKLNLTKEMLKWEERLELIYLPKPTANNLVIPQDDTYLQKKEIDLTKYKEQDEVGTIFNDYNLEQVNEIQVSKQADIMALFYLLEDYFSSEVKAANWNYYEPKTLHDSSLSLSIHSVLASDLGDSNLAYRLFKKASTIDLGSNMKSSDHGIHAASLGGIWQCVVNGFGGIRVLEGQLRIEPKLPENWSKLVFPIYWHGDRLKVVITKESVIIENITKENKRIEFLNHENLYILIDKITIQHNHSEK
ncbi:glycoside hydrolase family 65 protein [Chengkuizengella axinellae]|uniref:Glycosyl hydrolase family 65 protein n=1 Tax=Chengkuizengella axinellae TaxID=3064388 RepID=A0ABT9IUK3_9BACL|nr:glycosyl hydrolase family 65 protein [Chengkuizengella sp. 2205SS18-9]MDP5273040.1 glycosyl hydrolase family 65 protein [Chengkuizengella sp. 2205SS18-9]